MDESWRRGSMCLICRGHAEAHSHCSDEHDAGVQEADKKSCLRQRYKARRMVLAQIAVAVILSDECCVHQEAVLMGEGGDASMRRGIKGITGSCYVMVGETNRRGMERAGLASAARSIHTFHHLHPSLADVCHTPPCDCCLAAHPDGAEQSCISNPIHAPHTHHNNTQKHKHTPTACPHAHHAMCSQ